MLHIYLSQYNFYSTNICIKIRTLGIEIKQCGLFCHYQRTSIKKYIVYQVKKIYNELK
jgi:hypothetical protein